MSLLSHWFVVCHGALFVTCKYLDIIFDVVVKTSMRHITFFFIGMSKLDDLSKKVTNWYCHSPNSNPNPKYLFNHVFKTKTRTPKERLVPLTHPPVTKYDQTAYIEKNWSHMRLGELYILVREESNFLGFGSHLLSLSIIFSAKQVGHTERARCLWV